MEASAAIYTLATFLHMDQCQPHQYHKIEDRSRSWSHKTSTIFYFFVAAKRKKQYTLVL